MRERRWSIVTGQNDRLAQETLREQYERIARQAIVVRGAVFMSLRLPSRTGWTFHGVQLGRCQRTEAAVEEDVASPRWGQRPEETRAAE
jgi:hypothetical protein